MERELYMAKAAPKKPQNKFQKNLANGLEMAYLNPKMVNNDPTGMLHFVCTPESSVIFILENYIQICPQNGIFLI